MAAISHCQLTVRLAPVRSKRTTSRRNTTVRAVQTPAKPSVSTRENVKSTPLDAFPKSAVKSRETPRPANETFDKAYKDYSTGYASVPPYTNPKHPQNHSHSSQSAPNEGRQ